MIDDQRLKELLDTIGAEDLTEISKSYFEETEEVLIALENAPNDREGVLARLLFLQSNAAVLGLRQFRDLCRQGRAQFNNCAPSLMFFQQLTQIYQASKQAFTQALGQDRAA